MTTIGELTNVPEPGAPVASAWAQDVSSRIVHRFASVAAAAASNLPNGAVANVAGRLYVRVAGAWQIVAPPEFYSWPSFGVGAITPGGGHVEVSPRVTLKAGLWQIHRQCYYGSGAPSSAQLNLITGTLVGGLTVHLMAAHSGGNGSIVLNSLLVLATQLPDVGVTIQNMNASGNIDTYSDPRNNFGYAIYYGPQTAPNLPAGGSP